MRRLLVVFWLACACGAAAGAQEKTARFTDRAGISHHSNSATVVANDPRPLEQAITAVSQEYGWLVSFEDPPYHSEQDLVDDTSGEWRSLHPGAKGFRIVAGGAFQSEYPEGPDTFASKAEEARVLNTIISDYNRSGNPGKFTLREQVDGTYVIVGTSVKNDSGTDEPVSSILDNPITLPTTTRDAFETISLILERLSAKSGTTVLPATVPTNVLAQSRVTIGGQNVSARALLLQTIAATKSKMVWHLLYNADSKTYYLNILLAQQALYDTFGNRTTVQIR